MIKYLFIDRDGTLIKEPSDEQIDSLEKLELIEAVIPVLLELKKLNFKFVMVTNQDGLGTNSFPTENFEKPQAKMLDIFKSQGICFDDILICPHFAKDNCDCRKPKIQMLTKYLTSGNMDKENSYVIGDRDTDVKLADNMGIKSFKLGDGNNNTYTWNMILNTILNKNRKAKVVRKTKETNISIEVNLDATQPVQIKSGVGFLDHMLDQLARHGGFSLILEADGDLIVDEHHTVEDIAITLGQAIKKALGDKLGIGRFGFVVPMDESYAEVSLDLSGRSFLIFDCKFTREKIGDLPTELIEHFWRSFSESLSATIHIKCKGVNEHHMCEAIFKSMAKAVNMAISKTNNLSIPSTKGTL